MTLRRTAALVTIWCACAAPAARPAPARLPDAVERAIDAVSEADLRASVELLASDRLAAIAARYPDAELTTRGRGLIQALATSIAPGLPDAISEEAFTRGLVIETAGARGRALKLIPSLTIDDSTLERGLDIVEESVAAALAR